MSAPITILSFVQLIWNSFSTAAESTNPGAPAARPHTAASLQHDQSLLHYGHVAGWLEDQDEAHPDWQLDKRTAARILHQFMKKELHLPDVQNISAAEELKDLYTCRVCANHVAQIYVQGIMDCEEEVDPATGKAVKLFNMLSPVTTADAAAIVGKIQNQLKTNPANSWYSGVPLGVLPQNHS